MKTIRRILAMLLFSALASGVFAGSLNLSSGNPYLTIDTSGPVDCTIKVFDNNTSQLVLELYAGSLGASVVTNNWSLSVTPAGTGGFEIFDLPYGDYEIRTIPAASNWGDYDTGNSNWAMIVDYDYGSSDEVRTEMYNHGGWFY